MKSFFLISLFLSSLLSSCNSDDKNNNDNSIIGTWKLIESYGSDGTQGSWTTIDDGHSYTFNLDNMISSDKYSCVGNYIINEELEYSLSIVFNCQNIEFNGSYQFEFENGQLVLYGNPISCDEGCGEKYERSTEK